MIENKFTFTFADQKLIERVIEDDNVAINHIILGKGDALPEHYSNSNVYMVVIRGNITLALGDQEKHMYPAGSILTIPYNVKMNVSNQNEDVLEFFVAKAPSPKMFGNT
jgi:quercetin dioxygenase-like cupin family protein